VLVTSNDRKYITVFGYDKEKNIITVDAESGWVGLKGGLQKKGLRLFPLSNENINILFRKYRHGTIAEGYDCHWKLSLVEAIETIIKTDISMAGKLTFLHSLTLEKVRKYPVLYKSPVPDLPVPFNNQKVSQYWLQYVEAHALLWEMGPLAGNTLLVTDKGIIKLKEYNNEYVANPEGLHQSNGLIEKQAKELIEVVTYHGSKLTGTPEHEILTINGTKTFSELFVGEKLLIGHPGVFPEESLVSDNYARALGMMVAEGTCNKPQIEFLYEGNEDLIENIRMELKPQGETTRIVGGKKTWRAWWSTATVRQTKGNSFPEKYSENGFKIIPECILRSNERTQIQFLYGYFRGDGTIGRRSKVVNFKLTERDEDLVDIVQLMLFNIGIETKKYKYADVNAYNLTAPHDETIKMIEIGLLDSVVYEKNNKGNNGKGYEHINGHLISKIVSVKRYTTNETVYCLNMKNTQHLFYGNGISVHNTGKTRAIGEGYEIKKAKGFVKHGLVICPVSMLNKWVEEIKLWSGNENAVALRGSRAEKLELLACEFEWYVTNFETVMTIIEDLEKIVNNKWFITLDEFTKIKNPHARRSKACVKLGELTKHKAILSGTPITQNAYDIFTPFLFLDRGETFGLNYERFIDEYFMKSGYRKIAYSGSLEKISEKMFNSSTRFRKKECIDIPDKIYDPVILELPPENREKYDQMVKDAIILRYD